jgi:hypothetical protein
MHKYLVLAFVGVVLCGGPMIGTGAPADAVASRKDFMTLAGFEVGRPIDPRSDKLTATRSPDEFTVPLDRAATGFDEIYLKLSSLSHTLAVIEANAKYASADECEAQAKRFSQHFADAYKAKVKHVKKHQVWTAVVGDAEREFFCLDGSLQLTLRDPRVTKLYEEEAARWAKGLSCDREPVQETKAQMDDQFSPLTKAPALEVAVPLDRIASRVEYRYITLPRDSVSCLEPGFLKFAAVVDQQGRVRAVQLLATDLRVSRLIDSAQDEVWREHFDRSADASYRLVELEMRVAR